MASKVSSFHPWDPDCRVALVCGGGPAGLLTACVLAKHGYRVHLFEKRQDPTKSKPGRSWSIVLQQRSLKSLKLVDLDMVSSGVGQRQKGAMLHSNRGQRELLYPSDADCIRVDRIDLMKELLGRCDFDGGPDMHFESSFAGLSADRELVKFAGPLDGPQGPWALLVAADGEHSSVRAELQKLHGFTYSQVPSTKDYIQILMPVKGLREFGLDGSYIHAFSNNPSNAQLILTERHEGTGGGVFVLNRDGEYSFGMLRAMDDADQKKFLQRALGQEGASLLEVAFDGKFKDYLEAAEVFPGNAITHCPRFDGAEGRVLVLGDAAHSMTATLGQGCNTALEDVFVLNGLLEDGTPCRKLAAEYTVQRHEDVESSLDLSVNAFPSSKIGFLGMIARSSLSAGLYRTFPNCFPAPSQQLFATDTPYRLVRRRKKFEARFCTASCAAVGTGLVALCAPFAAKCAGIMTCLAFGSALKEAR